MKVKKNKKVMGIYLSIQLSGPKPWRIQGVVEVKIIFKVRIPIDVTIGQRQHDRLLDVQVLPLLQAAVEDVRNWETVMPEERTLLVSLREASSTSDKIVVHPSGKLSLSQKVVPLRMQINKFGKQRPSDHQWFDLEAREAGGTAWPKEAEREEWFAPADFREMNDGQKLASKSFVEMPAGMQLKSNASVQMGDFRQIRCEYEKIIMERRYEPQQAGTYTPTAKVFASHLKAGSAARAPLGRLSQVGASPFVPSSGATDAGRSTLAPRRIKIKKSGGFAIVGKRNLQLFEDMQSESQVHAQTALAQLLDERPELSGTLQIMPSYAISA